MRGAVIGSRSLRVDHLENYLPEDVTEIVSGGARGIDACAQEYALARGLKLTEVLPKYEKYGRSAPLRQEQGMDVVALSRLLGHVNPSITLDKYGHAVDEHKRSSVEKLGGVYSAGRGLPRSRER